MRGDATGLSFEYAAREAERGAVEKTRLAVRLSPRAARTEIGGFEGDELRVRVTAPPVDGRANAALTPAARASPRRRAATCGS